MFKKFLFIFFVLIFSFVSLAEQEGNESSDLKLEDTESPDLSFLKKVKSLRAKKLSDLVYLSPFSDVSVIQRRFMPKTGRVSFSALSTFTLSSEFFLNPGIEGHLTYHFLEKHGLELSGYYVFTFERNVSKDLDNRLGVKVSEELPIANSFFGLTYKWMPVYGKIAFYNNQILAFDTFFNLGFGMSGVKFRKITWEPVMVLGIGQVFAITRDLGLRWDLRWHMILRTQAIDLQILNDILFSIGLSYYYPSAGLR